MPDTQFPLLLTVSMSMVYLLPLLSNCCCCLVTKQHFTTPQTVACQAPLSMGISRPEYWSRLPFPSPGDPPDPGIQPVSPALADRFSIAQPPGKPNTEQHEYGIFITINQY